MVYQWLLHGAEGLGSLQLCSLDYHLITAVLSELLLLKL